MVRFELDVEDLAVTRFAISPLTEDAIILGRYRIPVGTRCTCHGYAGSAAGWTRSI